jgi:hypothetical protein
MGRKPLCINDSCFKGIVTACQEVKVDNAVASLDEEIPRQSSPFAAGVVQAHAGSFTAWHL